METRLPIPPFLLRCNVIIINITIVKQSENQNYVDPSMTSDILINESECYDIYLPAFIISTTLLHVSVQCDWCVWQWLLYVVWYLRLRGRSLRPASVKFSVWDRADLHPAVSRPPNCPEADSRRGSVSVRGLSSHQSPEPEWLRPPPW